MNRRQKIITIALWGAFVLVTVGVVVGQFWRPRQQTPPLPTLFSAGSFALTDENGRPFSDKDLHGRPYIASMIFTTCPDLCPIMSGKMATVQRQTPAAVQLVSFTVNPAFDTPAVLKDYGRRFGADEARWHFLTGSLEQMHEAAEALKLGLRDAGPDKPILHSDNLLLIDGDGNVRGIYSGKDEEAVKRLIADATSLAAKRGST